MPMCLKTLRKYKPNRAFNFLAGQGAIAVNCVWEPPATECSFVRSLRAKQIPFGVASLLVTERDSFFL